MRWLRSFPCSGAPPLRPAGFIAVAPERLGAGRAAPPHAVPAAETTLGSHPCVALSSAQVLPEWNYPSLAVNAFPANGDYPLNSVSHSRGSLHGLTHAPRASPGTLPSPPFHVQSGCGGVVGSLKCAASGQRLRSGGKYFSSSLFRSFIER